MIVFSQFPVMLAAVDQIKHQLGSLTLDELQGRSNRHECVLNLLDWLKGLQESCASVPISRSLRFRIDEVIKSLQSSSFTVGHIVSVCNDIAKSLIIELGEHTYLFIPSDDRKYLDTKAPLFGPEVARSFPGASRDIAGAGRCLALDEGTACVFHLMRVAEIGLRVFAVHLGVTSSNLSLENWRNIIDQIEKKIREMESLPKSPEKSVKMQAYSEAASQFFCLKEAWRNHVSHSRANYDRKEAENILNAVKLLLQRLAAIGIHESENGN